MAAQECGVDFIDSFSAFPGCGTSKFLANGRVPTARSPMHGCAAHWNACRRRPQWKIARHFCRETSRRIHKIYRAFTMHLRLLGQPPACERPTVWKGTLPACREEAEIKYEKSATGLCTVMPVLPQCCLTGRCSGLHCESLGLGRQWVEGLAHTSQRLCRSTPSQPC